MGRRVSDHPVRSLKQCLLPGQQSFCTRTVRSQFSPLIDLLVIGGDKWIKYQWDALLSGPSACCQKIALPETGHPDQIRPGEMPQPGFPVPELGELRLKVQNLLAEVG